MYTISSNRPTCNVFDQPDLILGRTMSSGAVGSVKRVRNPVEAARAVMERSEHTLLVGEEATSWAGAQGLQMENEVSAWLPDGKI